MSKDGTLPPGTEHHHVDSSTRFVADWAFSGVEPDACEHCLEDLKGDEVETGMCDHCAVKHFRGLFFNLKKKTLNEA